MLAIELYASSGTIYPYPSNKEISIDLPEKAFSANKNCIQKACSAVRLLFIALGCKIGVLKKLDKNIFIDAIERAIPNSPHKVARAAMFTRYMESPEVPFLKITACAGGGPGVSYSYYDERKQYIGGGAFFD